jgi:hypothetical protein
MLKYSKANAKIAALRQVTSLQPYLENKRRVYSFDLLSGHSCPFAKNCLSKVAVNASGKRSILDGKWTQFRCFSASQEVVYPSVYTLRKGNFDLLRKFNRYQIAEALQDAMPDNLGICRLHVGGDLFSPRYLQAWIDVAAANPDRLYYAYTKSLRYWVTHRQRIESTPNLVLTASYGGRDDNLIDQHGLRSVRVVYTEQEASDQGLPLDHDDSHAADPTRRDQSFALLIHGVQPAGTPAAAAKQALKGKGSYSR